MLGFSVNRTVSGNFCQTVTLETTNLTQCRKCQANNCALTNFQNTALIKITIKISFGIYAIYKRHICIDTAVLRKPNF